MLGLLSGKLAAVLGAGAIAGTLGFAGMGMTYSTTTMSRQMMGTMGGQMMAMRTTMPTAAGVMGMTGGTMGAMYGRMAAMTGHATAGTWRCYGRMVFTPAHGAADG